MEWRQIRWYHRYSVEADLSFSQFQAVISAGPDRMLLVNGATLREPRELRMPVFEEILDSLRIVIPG